MVSLATFTSCVGSYQAAIPLPPYETNTTTYHLTMQNMDNEAVCDLVDWQVKYPDMGVRYVIKPDKKLVLEIDNKSNKTIIIDKAKCYVIIDGYSNPLFKDVRSGRSTTYGNVLDAVTNVQTNENSVTLQIPPYSRWTLPVGECNVPYVPLPKSGVVREYSVYEAEKTVEYIFTYTQDYTLAQWKTSRNRLWVNRVTKEMGTSTVDLGDNMEIDKNRISVTKTICPPERRAAIGHNERVRQHNLKVDQEKEHASMAPWAILSIVVSIGGLVAMISAL